MTQIILSGCNGHMGQTVCSVSSGLDDVKIVAGVDVNTDNKNGFPVFSSIKDCDVKADVIIDFSSPKVLDDILSYGREKNVPLVLCTTGYDSDQISRIEETSKEVAILRSANMSIGINILAKILKETAEKFIGSGFDCEIVEKHHRLKKDAPSGTALLLADAVNAGLKENLDYVYDRSKRNEQRPDAEIGISAIRGGTIPGDHDVIFAGTDEVITFSHKAYSKAVFAKGAVKAAQFLKDKAAGLYSMSDVLG
ncbi:MAG: 4-hydroxy-tetrahydrodipicolinate reductase [Lachnospiraceae bacterium]|nr:4-hydroxy-tetrahydrodipicolinate reductase [Lachnospiraceae bacterium]